MIDFEKAELVSVRRVTSERVVNWFYIKYHGTLLEIGDNENRAIELLQDLREKSRIQKQEMEREKAAHDQIQALGQASQLGFGLGKAVSEFKPVEGSPEWARLGPLAPVWDKLWHPTRAAAMILAGILK